MPIQHEKVNLLEGGWYVVYTDGTVKTMDEVGTWIKVPNKSEISIMGLKCRSKVYELKKKDNNPFLPPGRTEMREISVEQTGEIKVTKSPIMGWFIGYYDTDTEEKVIVRANKVTGKFSVERASYVSEE
jgi:hypothetical protein